MKQNNNDKQYGGQAGGQPGRYVISALSWSLHDCCATKLTFGMIRVWIHVREYGYMWKNVDTCEKMWLHVKECDIYELMALLVTTQQVFLQLADIDDQWSHTYRGYFPYSDPGALLTYL